MKIKVSDIHSNPFRPKVGYRDERLSELRESIVKTHFWGNIVVRLCSNGRIEQAYGHHRTKAVLDLYGPDYEIDVVVKDLSDGEMLKMLARENMEDVDALADLSLLKHTVQVLAEGRIEIPVNGAKEVHYAPSFKMQPFEAGRPGAYTQAALARFLGYRWLRPKEFNKKGKPLAQHSANRMNYSMVALQLVEDGVFDGIEQFEGVSTTQLEKLVSTTMYVLKSAEEKAARHEAEALAAQKKKTAPQKEAAKEKRVAAERRNAEKTRENAKKSVGEAAEKICERLRAGEMLTKDIKAEVLRNSSHGSVEDESGGPEVPKWIGEHADDVRSKYDYVLRNGKDKLMDKMNGLLNLRVEFEQSDPAALAALVQTLVNLSGRAIRVAKQLQGGKLSPKLNKQLLRALKETI